MLLHILRRQFLPEIGDVGQALGQDTGLIVVEGVNVNGGVALKGPDIVDLAGVDALGTLDRLPQGVAPGVVVPDEPAGHAQLLGTNHAVLIGKDTGAGRHIDAGGRAADLIENQGVEHMDPLGNDDAVLVALHGLIAAGSASLEIVPGNIHLLAVQQAADAADQQVHVDAVRGLPVGSLRRTLVQGQEKVVHAQQADLDAQIFQVVAQAHGGGGLAAAGGAGQRHDAALTPGGQDSRRSGGHLVVEYLLAAQDELRLVVHGLVNGLQIDDTHKASPFKRGIILYPVL